MSSHYWPPVALSPRANVVVQGTLALLVAAVFIPRMLSFAVAPPHQPDTMLIAWPPLPPS